MFSNQPLNFLRWQCILLLVASTSLSTSFSQNGVAINTSGASADNSAILDLSNTINKGFLLPQVTSVSLITTPAKGLIVYQTNSPAGIYCNTGTSSSPNWLLLNSATGSGSSGQFLMSNGAASPSWSNLAQSIVTVYGSSSLNISANQTTFALIPGLTTSINIPSTGSYFVYVSTDGGIQTTSAAASGFSACDIAVMVDGARMSNGGFKRLTVLNSNQVVNNFGFWSMSAYTSLSAGNHTISVYAASANFSGQSSSVIGGDNTTFLQPALTVIVLRQ